MGAARIRRCPCGYLLGDLPLPAGSLRLADLGFYNRDVLAQIHAAGGYWLSRVQSNTLVAYPGRKPPLISLLHDIGSMPTWDAHVIIGGHTPLHARRMVRRVRQEVADQRRRREHAEANANGRPAVNAALALADWNVAITNVPQRLLSLAAALVLIASGGRLNSSSRSGNVTGGWTHGARPTRRGPRNGIIRPRQPSAFVPWKYFQNKFDAHARAAADPQL